MRDGLLPTLGAGADALEAQFGVPVPGVYLSVSWGVAPSYPNDPTLLFDRFPIAKKVSREAHLSP